ncbi:MAG: 16S rRNA (cytosine(1402)-N(4))-methyltransferase RsmH [Candidatus Saccharibacteria bacterium]|nr:16S rRNA (cytosine(1402)-N(4))-methyltransferase RsmH [Candidatus Saccharibacteria bacterium]
MMSIKEHPPQPEATNAPVHVPVLLGATVDKLQPMAGESYLDLTAGYGGHARAFLQRTDNYLGSVLVDRDHNAIATLDDLAAQGVRLMHMDFVSAARELVQEGRTFDIILADLGVSSPQLDRAERGFSFRFDGPLDMRMDNRTETTAAVVVNSYTERELVRLLVQYGEEPLGRARRIAKAIVGARPLERTAELAALIERTLGRGGLKQHPATRTFQALRIEVNRELRLIDELLPLLPRLLNRGGRVGIISFHSLEDRRIKQYFAEQAKAGYEAELLIPEKKPVPGTDDVHNPRSRSAKFRWAVKT